MRGPYAMKWLLATGLGAISLLCAPTSSARAEAETGYSKAQTFSAALRYLRVDLEYEVTEKDADVAYVLFRFVPSGQRELVVGSIEVVEIDQAVKLQVQISKLPGYYETVLRDGLLSKLREEYGEPVKRPKGKGKDKKKDRDEDKEKHRGRDKDKGEGDGPSKDTGNEPA